MAAARCCRVVREARSYHAPIPVPARTKLLDGNCSDDAETRTLPTVLQIASISLLREVNQS